MKIFCCCFHPWIFFPLSFRESGGEKEEGKWEKQGYERDTSIDWLLYVPWLGGEQTRNPGMCPWPGIEPFDSSVWGWRSNHWATAQGENILILLVQRSSEKKVCFCVCVWFLTIIPFAMGFVANPYGNWHAKEEEEEEDHRSVRFVLESFPDGRCQAERRIPSHSCWVGGPPRYTSFSTERGRARKMAFQLCYQQLYLRLWWFLVWFSNAGLPSLQEVQRDSPPTPQRGPQSAWKSIKAGILQVQGQEMS